MSFLALGNPSANHNNTIFYRTASCTCSACWTGEFEGCENADIVPRWQSAKMAFHKKPLARSNQRNTADIRKIIQTLKDHKQELPIYYCLARQGDSQCPTVLLMSHLQLNALTVRCHVLQPFQNKANDFGHCLNLFPLNRCNNIEGRCNCNLDNHATNFQISDILEVAVFRENGRYKTHFQRTRGEEEALVDLPSTPKGDLLFEKYATKRFQYFNDLFTK